jgi:hydrogenase nickel incorporation protein HypB
MNQTPIVDSSERCKQSIAQHYDESFVGHPPAEAMVRMALARAGVPMIRLIGTPGAGKTELICATLRRLADPKRVAVIAVNPASSRDADRMRANCGHVEHIEAAVPSAAAMWRVIANLQLADFDLILVEGSSAMAALPDIGQDATVAVLAYTGGDDKAAEYRPLIEAAALVLLTKSDLRFQIAFDEATFREDIRSANTVAEITDISAATGEHMEQWCAWLNRLRLAKRPPLASTEQESEWYIG